MSNAIILHGLPSKAEYYSDKYPSASNSHWLPWLQKQLMIHDIKADTPEIPHTYNPTYETFVDEVERFEINANTMLVGHSLGAGFWLRYLSERPQIYVNKVVLVGPWLNLDHEYDISFFNFEIDQTLASRTNELIVFSSDNDGEPMHRSVQFIKQNLPSVTIRAFHDYGHFTLDSMKTNAFPELLDVLI